MVNSVHAKLVKKRCKKGGKWVVEKTGPVARGKVDAQENQPALADIDGDGKKDLVIGAEDGRLYVRPLAKSY